MQTAKLYYYKEVKTHSLASSLAIDELLLNHVNENSHSSGIRFYDSQETSVVLGLGNKVQEHVRMDACHKDNISILRRCSGGGSILQGKGCLSYALFLRYEDFPECNDIKNTTENLLNKLCIAFQKKGINAQMKGISDVAIENKKIIGNAQRRLKNACLFHGCILYNFDISWIESYLKAPPTAPEYRKNRKHTDFVTLVNLNKEDLIETILSIWPYQEKTLPIPEEAIEKLTLDKYYQDTWNLKI